MDQDDENSIEEGEISNDSDNNYTPLARPSNYSASAQPQQRFPTNLESESEEEQESSDSDSDSDSQLKKTKKPKIKLKPKSHYKPERKKYDIWSTRVQEDVLAETLNSCDVTTKDRSRNVETYDYTLGSKYYNDIEQEEDIKNHFKEKGFVRNNKRTRNDRKNMNFKQQKRRSHSRESVKGSERTILDLVVDENCSEEVLAKEIANKLYEEKEDLILNVINTLGKKKAIDMFEETKNIEKKGGMLIMNQTRRRTPGGVYLFLVRHDYNISQEEKNSIFGEERQRSKLFARQKQKDKLKKLKGEIVSSKSKLLPELLCRAEAELRACQNPTRKIKEQCEDEEVINPPPTPETDGHDNENSMDGPPLAVLNGDDSLENSRGKLNTYDDDFLDIGCSADMDLF